MTTPLVFLDTETTGLHADDQVWEFAAIRRDPDGHETEWHAFLKHDIRMALRLPPDSFLQDYRSRYDPRAALDVHGFRRYIWPLFEGRPHVIGAVPDFDSRHLRRLLGTNVVDDPWHYHLIDVETLAIGYLRGHEAAADVHGRNSEAGPVPTLPWSSDNLSIAVGVDPPGPGNRHTALGDVRWAARIWDAVMGAPARSAS